MPSGVQGLPAGTLHRLQDAVDHKQGDRVARISTDGKEVKLGEARGSWKQKLVRVNLDPKTQITANTFVRALEKEIQGQELTDRQVSALGADLSKIIDRSDANVVKKVKADQLTANQALTILKVTQGKEFLQDVDSSPSVPSLEGGELSEELRQQKLDGFANTISSGDLRLLQNELDKVTDYDLTKQIHTLATNIAGKGSPQLSLVKAHSQILKSESLFHAYNGSDPDTSLEGLQADVRKALSDPKYTQGYVQNILAKVAVLYDSYH